jgi:hypothetical protein
MMPVDQTDASPPVAKSKANLLAALEDIKANNKSHVAAVKPKLTKFCGNNGTSSSNRLSTNN